MISEKLRSESNLDEMDSYVLLEHLIEMLLYCSSLWVRFMSYLEIIIESAPLYHVRKSLKF